MKEFRALCSQGDGETGHTRDIVVGTIKTGYETGSNRIVPERKYKWNVPSRPSKAGVVGGACGSPKSRDHIRLKADQLGHHFRYAIEHAIGPAVFDRHIFALDVACSSGPRSKLP